MIKPCSLFKSMAYERRAQSGALQMRLDRNRPKHDCAMTLFTYAKMPETDDGPQCRTGSFIIKIETEAQPLNRLLTFAKPIGSLGSPANAKRPVKQPFSLSNKRSVIMVEWFYAVWIGKHRPVSV